MTDFNTPQTLLDLQTKISELEHKLQAFESNKEISSNYLRIIKSMNVGVWEWDVQTNKTVFNERWAEIIGYTLEELQPTTLETWINLANKEDLAASDAKIQACFNHESQYYDAEIRMRHKNGHWIWVHDRGQVAIWSDEGKPLKMIGTHTDISQSKYLTQMSLNDRYAELVENAPFPIIITRINDGTLQYSNQRAKVKFDVDDLSTLGVLTSKFYVNPDDRKRFLDLLSKNHSVYDFEVELVNSKGSHYWALMSASFTEFNSEPSLLVTINDISKRKKMEEALLIEKKNYELLATSISDVIWVYNIDQNRFNFMSPSVENLTGYTAEEAIQFTLAGSVHKSDHSRVLSVIEEKVKTFINDHLEESDFIVEVQQPCKDKSNIWVEVTGRILRNDAGQIILIGSSRNVDERKLNQIRLEYVNNHDLQTGLLNKFAFKNFEQEFLLKPYSIIYVDVDNFGQVNDVMGHQVGDEIISEIALKLERFLPKTSKIFHYDGDEFVVVIDDSRLYSVQKLCKNLSKTITKQIKIADRHFVLTSSIGFCIAQEGDSIESTFKKAGSALYIAKRTKNTIIQYETEMDHVRERELKLEKELYSALQRNQISLNYQPIFDLRKGQINHVEALMRWLHPEYGQISPYEFIPIAERSKMILPLTFWAVDEACQAIGRWKEAGNPNIVVSVNLSFAVISTASEEFLSRLKQSLTDHKINPTLLKIEVTESVFAQDTDEIIHVFRQLKNLGIQIALDDFGTGYSSFGYLKSLPLDIVKIDRSLVSSIDINIKEKMIVESMITILHGLGLNVVVEGIETLAQYHHVAALNPDFIQGYLISKPLTEIDLLAYLKMEKKEDYLSIAFDPIPQNSSVKSEGFKLIQPNMVNSTNELEFVQSKLKENILLQALLSEISSILTSVDVDDFDRQLYHALRRCALQVRADRAYVFTYDWQANTCTNTHEWCDKDITPQISELQDVPLEAIPDWVKSHEKGQSIHIPDIHDLDPNSNLYEILEPQGILSLMTVPMMAGEVCFGFIGFDSVKAHHEYSEFEQHILTEVSNIILVAMKRKSIENVLELERDFFESMVTSLHDGVIMLDLNANITYMNHKAEQMFDLKNANIVNTNIQNIFFPIHAKTNLPIAFNWDPEFIKKEVQLFPNNTLIKGLKHSSYVTGQISNLSSQFGKQQGIMVILHDVTKEVEYQVQIDAILNVNLEMFAVATMEGTISQVNQRFMDVTGYAQEELVGRNFFEFIHVEDNVLSQKALDTLGQNKSIHGIVVRYYHRNGTIRYLEMNAQLGIGSQIFASASDITEKKIRELEHEYLSYHDVMTDLYNRAFIENKLKVLSHMRDEHPLSILMVDLDNLKEVNDALGHHEGDSIIQSLSDHLKNQCRPEDLVGRWGGDEFIVVLPKTDINAAHQVAKRIMASGENLHFKYSVGVATKLDQTMTFPEVIRLADQRMYEMKKQQKTNLTNTDDKK